MSFTSHPAPVSKPPHVPAELVVDFDIYHPPGGDRDVHRAWMTLQAGPPIVWTPRNGGHWIATRAVDLAEMQTNWQVFSYESINIPRNPTPSLPLECDPPLHTELRALISPLFAPATLMQAEKLARELASSLLQEIQPRGKCEFKHEFALHLPIVIFLRLMDLPLEGREYLLSLVEKRVRSSVAEERNAAKAGFIEYTRDAVATRLAHPGSDFISRILHGNVNGRKLTQFEAENLLATVLSGGLDTVASMMSFAMASLARQPALAQRLATDRGAIPRAVDELIRRHGLSNTARIIPRDTDYKGVHFKKGEHVVVPTALIGLDPEAFPNPLEIDIDRAHLSKHGSFGAGVHRCPGANLGRLEIRVVLEEWLTRIPQFRISPEKPLITASGLVSTLHELHLEWDC
jgi:cytochrome P450